MILLWAGAYQKWSVTDISVHGLWALDSYSEQKSDQIVFRRFFNIRFWRIVCAVHVSSRKLFCRRQRQHIQSRSRHVSLDLPPFAKSSILETTIHIEYNLLSIPYQQAFCYFWIIYAAHREEFTHLREALMPVIIFPCGWKYDLGWRAPTQWPKSLVFQRTVADACHLIESSALWVSLRCLPLPVPVFVRTHCCGSCVWKRYRIASGPISDLFPLP